MRGLFQNRHSAGFTLVEVILSITLLAITVAVTSVLMGRGLDAYYLVNTRTESLEQAQSALGRMQKEMTKVREINNAQPDRFGFRDDLGNNTDYHREGIQLYRGEDRLAQNVTSLNFTYYRDNGTTTTAPPQVRRIRIDMEVASGAGSGPIVLRTDVFPRIFLYENFQ